ncbi:Gldg family protein [Chitinophaga sp.]|uniref:ABC transporter permease subunit n=1 Tax=Chitinophaga sp. TaxID=1869181 RepID=UPI0026320D44|nr:Gldg family protein [uncultured Chitinophaga sp.]
MGIILKIAKAELRTLFYSPIAWFLIVVFFVVCAIQYVDPVVGHLRMQDVMLESDPNWKGFDGAGLSIVLFGRVYGAILSNLYLFLPLLTMGVMNREIQSGSIKLLYSSPVRTWEVVLGKYLGLMAFNLVLIACVAVFMVTGLFTIVDVDYNWYMAVLLSMFLLSGTYAAIGLFISCCTGYQIVAGILTFALLFVLNSLHMLWQQYDFVRDLTWFLSLAERAERMMAGLITTRDLAYFLLIIGMFVGFSCIRLKSTQESKPWSVSFMRYTGLFLLVLALGYFSSRPHYVGYLDVTRKKIHTINENTQQVVKELDGSPLDVTLYVNLLGTGVRAGVPEMRNLYVWNYWEQYRRFYPNLHLKYEYYYDLAEGDTLLLRQLNASDVHEAARKAADLLNERLSIYQKPEEMRKKIDLSPVNYNMTMLVEYKGRKEFLRTYGDMEVWPNQNHVSGLIRRLTRDSLPMISFTTGHYERSPYKLGEREHGGHMLNYAARGALVNKGVNIDTLNLKYQDIPDSTDILVVADPRSALAAEEERKIIGYLESGRNAILYAEPGKQQMMNPILKTLGVQVEDGLIVKLHKHEQAHHHLITLPRAAHYMADEPMLYYYRFDTTQPTGFLTAGVANLHVVEDKGFEIEGIMPVKPDEKTWIEKGVFVADSAAPVFDPKGGDVRRDQYQAGITMKRKVGNREQRIIVCGDADFMSALRTDGSGFANAGYSWMMYNEYPVYHNVPPATDKYMKLNLAQGKVIRITYVYVIPGAILLLGVLLLVRRKRK